MIPTRFSYRKFSPALRALTSGIPQRFGEAMSAPRGYDPAQVFRRLERTTGLIVRHPPFPGKEDAVIRCREDIEQRFLQGLLSEEQKARLLAILDEGDLPD